jgi:uncharacterized cupredoxin-like copper-binding protein
MTRTSLTLLAALALAVAACGGSDAPDPVTGGDDAPDPITELDVTGTDSLTFDPDEYSIPVGVEVTLTFTAGDGADHDFVIEGAADHGMVGDQGHGAHGDDDHMDMDDMGSMHVAHADPGMSTTARFRIDQAGTYEVYCSVPGHREAGMTAQLHVIEHT